MIKPGIIWGKHYKQLIDKAKRHQYALPAINITTMDMLNNVLEAASIYKSDIIIQLSYERAQFIAGYGLNKTPLECATIGALMVATHAHLLAKHYGICVVLHTDHANRRLIPWIEQLVNLSDYWYKQHKTPLFSSHMIDLSEEPIDQNIDTCKFWLKRFNSLGIGLEMELGITGGEEDGIGHELNSIKNTDLLYTNPADVLKAYNELNHLGNLSIAASFGNIHGVYKVGNVRLKPTILQDSQRLICQQKNISLSNIVNFVFHGGSGSSRQNIMEAIEYGVFKFNISTDIQFAYSQGIYQETITNNNCSYLHFTRKKILKKMKEVFHLLGSKNQTITSHCS